ncbi:MAG: alpha/beta fold hydrolase, partial [Acidimicrobiia bacterium]
GFWQAAWCWDEHVMGAMAALGYDCYAVSLRGHGGSEGRIRGGSIDDYVADVASIAATLEREPVVIGHSMGGFTTQHYLARGLPAAAGILVSSVPGRGAWRAALKAARNHPVVFARINATLNVGPLVETPERAREYLFAPSVPHSVVERYSARLQDASFRAFLDLLLKTPDLSKVAAPTLVIGGDEDAFFDIDEWQDTATGLGADLVIIPGAGHEIMLEEAWTRLVDHIDEFVSGLA